MNVLDFLAGISGMAGPAKLAPFSKEEACCFLCSSTGTFQPLKASREEMTQGQNRIGILGVNASHF